MKEVEKKKDLRSDLGIEHETYGREGIAQKATHKPVKCAAKTCNFGSFATLNCCKTS